jgi:hypothetical protein
MRPLVGGLLVVFALGDKFRRDVVSAKVGIGEGCRFTLAIFAGYRDSCDCGRFSAFRLI